MVRLDILGHVKGFWRIHTKVPNPRGETLGLKKVEHIKWLKLQSGFKLWAIVASTIFDELLFF